jgi:hypothetical protein
MMAQSLKENYAYTRGLYESRVQAVTRRVQYLSDQFSAERFRAYQHVYSSNGAKHSGRRKRMDESKEFVEQNQFASVSPRKRKLNTPLERVFEHTLGNALREDQNERVFEDSIANAARGDQNERNFANSFGDAVREDQNERVFEDSFGDAVREDQNVVLEEELNQDNNAPDEEEVIVERILKSADRKRGVVNAYCEPSVRAALKVQAFVAGRQRQELRDKQKAELHEQVKEKYAVLASRKDKYQLLAELCPEALPLIHKREYSKLRRVITLKLAETHPDKHVGSEMRERLENEEMYKLLLSLRDHFFNN